MYSSKYNALGLNRLGSPYNSDQSSVWTVSDSVNDQRTSQQSIWSPESVRSTSDLTLERKSAGSIDSRKFNAWEEPLEEVEGEEEKRTRCARRRSLLIGLVLALLIGGVVLATVLTLWTKSTTVISTTTTTTTSTTDTTTTTSTTTTSTSTTTTTSTTSTSTTSTTTTTTTTTTSTSTTSTTTTTTTTTTATSTTSTTTTTTTSTTSATTTTSTTTTTTTTSSTTSTTSSTSSTTSTTTSITSTTSVTTTTTPSVIIYSQSFTTGVTPSSQCTAWTSFVSQLAALAYTSMTISGSLDPTGVTLTDPTTIAGIALALRTSTAYGPVVANGRSWMVGVCGGGYELSAGGSICACTTADYLLRPCIGNSNYGGVSSNTCSGPSQTVTVTFRF